MINFRSAMCSILAALACCATLLPYHDAVAESPIVVLGEQENPVHKLFIDGFKQYLHQKNGSLEFFDIDTSSSVPSAATLEETLQREHSPLILSVGDKNLIAATQSHLDRPLVAGLTTDMSALEKNPGATGVVLDYKTETQLAWIRQLFPQLKTIGVLYNPAENRSRIEEAMISAQNLGLNLIVKEVDSPSELPVAMEFLFRRVDVLWGIADSVVLSRQTAKAILLTSFRNKVPFIAPSTAWVKAGALYALEFDYEDNGFQAGEIALSVLNGAKVSSIEPQEPRKVRYSLNLRTAEHMRLKLSDKVVGDAIQVFE